MNLNAPSLFTLCVASLTSPLALRESQIRAQTVDVFSTISHVRESLEKAKSLLASQRRTNRDSAYPWSSFEGSIQGTEAVLREVQLLVEPLRIDEVEQGQFRWKSKARWIAADRNKLRELMKQLGFQHRDLLAVIGRLENITLEAARRQTSARNESLQRIYTPTSMEALPPKMPSPHHLISKPNSTYTPSSLVDWKRKDRLSLLEHRTSTNSVPTTTMHVSRLSAPSEIYSRAFSSHQDLPPLELGPSSPIVQQAFLQPSPLSHPQGIPLRCTEDNILQRQTSTYDRMRSCQSDSNGPFINTLQVTQEKEVYHPPNSPEQISTDNDLVPDDADASLRRGTWLGGHLQNDWKSWQGQQK